MESTILCMLTSTLCLFTWALGSMAAVENATPPTVNVRTALGSMAEVENATQPTVNVTDSYWRTSNSTICKKPLNDSYDEHVEECWESFNAAMFNIAQEHWCNWNYIFRIYDFLQLCLEFNADRLCISFPNELAHNTFLKAHMYYFTNCSLLSEELMDPPENILLGLIFAPICIIPFLVTLVVYKSNTIRPQI
ncbi:receptor activity-modifying protein 2 isoform X2 [Ranitomeya variabilis]|uniref:receptor activity-modifying protein 2 isoform X2 n=1 Tax=Ranitomeya variabilis TaxID=490064 RepID=UPI004055C556